MTMIHGTIVQIARTTASETPCAARNAAKPRTTRARRQDRGVQARPQLRREVVGEKQAEDEDTDGHRQGRRGDDGVDVHARDVLERLRHDVQTTTDGREHRPDEEVWLYPNPNERLRRRCSTAPKLGMNYAHQNPNAAAADGDEHGARPVDALTLGALDALQRQDGTRDDLTHRDDRQLAAPFDDVMRVPWRPGAAFGDGGLGEFDGRHERGEREDDDTDHLHHRQQPVQPVVGVVGTREPRVVDPRPDDAEARETQRSDARRDVPVRVRELRRARGDGERQVEEQLERARDASTLVRSRPLMGRRRERRLSGPTRLGAASLLRTM